MVALQNVKFFMLQKMLSVYLCCQRISLVVWCVAFD
jgi:hypothetical protein